MIFSVEIGKNIVLLRRAQKISQIQAALDAGMSNSRWQQIERGCQNATVDTLHRMARAVGVAPLVLGVLGWSDEEIRRELWTPLPAPPGTEPFQLGNNIVLYRRALGLSQKELAERANVSAARLRDLEQGCANVTVAFLEEIAKVLGLSLLALGALGLSEAQVLDMVHQAREILERKGGREQGKLAAVAR